jgi:hypothetical protein
MATSSFSKSFIITSKEEADAIAEAIDTHAKIKIDKNITTPEKERKGVLKLKKMLSR